MKQLRFWSDETTKPDKSNSQRVREWGISDLRKSLQPVTDHPCHWRLRQNIKTGNGMGKGVPLKKPMANHAFAKNLDMLEKVERESGQVYH